MITPDAYRESQKERAAFERIRRAEIQYGVQLRKVARHVADIVRAFKHDDPRQVAALTRTLQRYSNLLQPWARAVATRMLSDVLRRDTLAWQRYATFLGEGLRAEIESAPTGKALKALLAAQVELITSLPRDAAVRVQEIATGSLYSGQRADALVYQIMQTGQVTKARANLIARTETARAAATLTQVRAQYIGSEGYTWKAVMDGRTRPGLDLPPARFKELNTLAHGSHRKLDGTFHRWTEPPIAGPRGERAHPGSIFNCRCIAIPQLPNSLRTR